MKNKLILAAMVCSTFFSSIALSNLTEKETLQIATDAYIYGYPLITMDLTRQVMTNVTKADGTHAPMGQLTNMRKYPDSTFHDVTAPNADTLYSVAWLDLKNEPYVLHVPNVGERYYLMPLLSGWTDVFSVPGTRTTGTKEQNFVITGPFWKGKLPKGMKEIKSPTNMVWLLGRTYCNGTKEDYEAVYKIQDQYKLVPLSAFGKEYRPPSVSVNSHVDMHTPVRDQVNALSAENYFKRLAELMKNNPPAKADVAILNKLAKIGIIPSKDFDIKSLDPMIAKSLDQAVKIAQEKIVGHFKKAGVEKNGWTFSTKTGSYKTDYLQRAFITALGLGANLPQDAIYPTAKVDSNGKTLNGQNKYVIHFAKNQLPPVNGFWSLTMYNSKLFFVDNPINRYSISERNHLKPNSDGSIDLYIQHESPGSDKESNWLPSPKEDFVLMFRFYWPKNTLIQGKWNPPGVVRWSSLK